MKSVGAEPASATSGCAFGRESTLGVSVSWPVRWDRSASSLLRGLRGEGWLLGQQSPQEALRKHELLLLYLCPVSGPGKDCDSHGG